MYKHTSPSGKCYIGITSAKNPTLRWGVGGRRYLYKHESRGEHVKFVNAIKKYGWDNFLHEILEENLTHKVAKEKEKYYIEKFDSYHNGYNGTFGGEGTIGMTGEKCTWYGRHHSEETKRKISEANKNKTWSEESLLKMCESKGVKPIVQLTLDGEFIKEWRSANSTKQENGYGCTSQILNCCNHKAKSAYGFYWMFLDDYEQKGFKKEMTFWNEPLKKAVNQYDLDGNLVRRFESIKEAAKELGCSDGEICHCCQKKKGKKTVYGYQWRYADDTEKVGKISVRGRKKVHQYTLDEKFIKEYTSISQASDITGVHSSDIGKCCRSKQKTAGGYIWRYVDEEGEEYGKDT